MGQNGSYAAPYAVLMGKTRKRKMGMWAYDECGRVRSSCDQFLFILDNNLWIWIRRRDWKPLLLE